VYLAPNWQLHEELERFYDLAIKPWANQLDAERKKFSEYNEMMGGVMQDVRRDEREECAKVADKWAVGWPHPSAVIAEEIRARGRS
jgi:3-methyladenine DNA glycosylase AlkC